MRSEKEQAEASAAAAESASAAARMKCQAMSDELAMLRESEHVLAAELESMRAALAERGLNLDAAAERLASLEIQER